MTSKFRRQLNAQWEQGKFVCVGLDSDDEKIPNDFTADMSKRRAIEKFNRYIIDETIDIAGSYKPNIAFYESLGPNGLIALEAGIYYIRAKDPTIPIILDFKRADIGNTNRGYVKLAQYFGVNAVTVNPLFGEEGLQPFFDQDDFDVIVLCKTSNKGSAEFQDRLVHITEDEAERWKIAFAPIPLYELMAYRVSREWHHKDNCALVVGATFPEQMKRVRAIIGDDMPILAPGIGKQGGDLAATLDAGLNSRCDGLVVNSSSGIIFDPDSRKAAQALDQEVRAFLSEHKLKP